MINPGTLDKFEERIAEFDRGIDFVSLVGEIGLGDSLTDMVRDAKERSVRFPDPFRDIRLSHDSLVALDWLVENLPELIAFARAAYAKPDCKCGREAFVPRTDWLGGVIKPKPALPRTSGIPYL